MLNRRPKAEISKALFLHGLSNLACFDNGPALFLGKLTVLSTLIQKLDFFFASERGGVLLIDEIAGMPLVDLPEVADVGIAGMAVPLFDTDKGVSCASLLEENSESEWWSPGVAIAENVVNPP